ncbi:TIM-barrel domain-containing protein [Clostridium acetobutylicum]|uniref:TIM-barrel domain-containing protein n=1 Tax=Clostridium acetobutylicum TaxID=1488 RepID=UPI00098CDA8B|nr:TIM-barrel domain-containing protein [Clostridium acetobutylicum]OOM04931.1 alpha-xylosidase BoGH31A precursor [Clostridium acetobutylicum]
MYNSSKTRIWKRTLYCLVAAAVVVSAMPQALNINVKADTNKVVNKNSKSSSQKKFHAKLNGNTLKIKKGKDETIIRICEPQVFKVDYKPNGKSSKDTLVVDPNKKWSTGNIVSSDIKSDPMVITTKKMVLKINKEDLSILVYDLQGKLLLKQDSTASKTASFTHNSGDRFYGINGYNFQEDSSKGMLRNGTESVYAGYQGHCGSPFVWSNDGYGLLVDSDGGSFTIGDTSLKYDGISKTDTDYYVMVGNPKEILSEESDVSGKAPMFPKWANGFTNTQWGWDNSLSGTGNDEAKLKSVINTYRSKQLPIDNFCLDFDWKKWGQDNYGEFKWNTDNFPDSQNGQLKAYMDSKGLKMTGIMKPRILADSKQGRYVTSKGWWLPGDSEASDYCSGKMMENVNFALPQVRKWWWNNIQGAFDKGIVGFWNDECDENVNFGNFGNMNMERAIYDGQRGHKNQRVWSLNRNYYAGAQRYSYGMWSGDISTGFDSMANQRERMLSAVNLGEAKWGMDTGGFNGGDPTPENYARWMEFSAFTPIFRVHGQDNKVRYPWAFGSTAEATAKKAMQLRYTLIPYIYSYDRSASQSGLGLVRSLMMEYPNDSNAANDKEAWMFGDYMLVSPVVQEGQTSKSIYLPEGNWIDYTTGREYTGGQTINYAVDSTNWSDIPLFIKSGAIIPTQDFENYVGEKKITDVYVDAFPGNEASSFDYYDDDGTSYNYENGSYFDQKMTLERAKDLKSVQFNISPKTGYYKSDLKNYIVKMHVKSSGDVTVGGRRITRYASYDELKNAQGEGYVVGTDTYGSVVYIKVSAGHDKNINVPCNQVQLTAYADVKGGTYTSPQKVSLKASDPNAAIYYTLDGTAPTVNSTKYTGPITIDSSKTLKFIVRDANGNESDVFTEQYTTYIKVHYKNPTNWSEPSVYYDNTAGGVKGPDWPGVKMNNDGNGWYSYIIKDTTAAKATFNDETNKSSVIDVTGEEWYENGTLYQYNPDITVSPSLKGGSYAGSQTLTLTSSDAKATIYYTIDGTVPTVNSTKYTGPITIDSSKTIEFMAVDGSGDKSQVYTEKYNTYMKVHFKNISTWAAPNIYFYDATGGVTGPEWPGAKMKDDGNGWYSYTIDNCTSAKVLFNDGVNQIPGHNEPGFDVSGEEWYKDGNWYKSNPN